MGGYQARDAQRKGIISSYISHILDIFQLKLPKQCALTERYSQSKLNSIIQHIFPISVKSSVLSAANGEREGPNRAIDNTYRSAFTATNLC